MPRGKFAEKNTAYKGLVIHRVNSSKSGGQHGALTLGSLVLSNACINCRSVFSCRQAAQLHFRNAVVRGYCIPNLGTTITTDIQSNTPITCKCCNAQLQSYDEYCTHLVQELDRRLEIRRPADLQHVAPST